MTAITQHRINMERQIEQLHHLIEDRADQSTGANAAAIAEAKHQAQQLEEILVLWHGHTLALIEQLGDLAAEVSEEVTHD